MRSDIGPAKKFANWDTVLVLEEMEAEFDDICSISASNNDDSGDENDPAPKRQRIAVSVIIFMLSFFCFAVICAGSSLSVTYSSSVYSLWLYNRSLLQVEKFLICRKKVIIFVR